MVSTVREGGHWSVVAEVRLDTAGEGRRRQTRPVHLAAPFVPSASSADCPSSSSPSPSA